MQTLGDTLRHARLDMGVSVADAARETRIRREYIEALEAGDPARLPPPVYTQGLVRTYAEFLGLSAQSLVSMYQAVPRNEVRTNLRPAIPHVPIPRSLPIRPILVGLGCIAAIVLVIFLWSLYQTAADAVRRDDPTGSTVRASTPTLPPGVPTPITLFAASPVPSPVASLSPAGPEIAAASPAPSATPVVDGILVQIRARQSVYVEASVDGDLAISETLDSGAERTLPLAKSMVIMRVSNPSVLDITVNGEAQPANSATTPMELTWRR